MTQDGDQKQAHMKSRAPTLKSKSPAEFFAENKNIAGFDNVRHHQLCVRPTVGQHAIMISHMANRGEESTCVLAKVCVV